MNAGRGQGGGSVAVEADVILRDLVKPSDKEGGLCPGYVQGFLQDEQEFSRTAAFQKEYLLDGRLMENNHVGHQNAGDEGTPGDSAVSNHVSGTQQNCARGEILNGARARLPYGAGSPVYVSQAGLDADGSVLNSNPEDDGDPPSKNKPDLVIEVGGQTINAHKSVLAAKSDYFKARLSRDILKVKGVSYKTLSTLIDYVYTSQMNVGKDNVVDVITGAKILQIPCAVQAATDSMSAQITAENCYEILTIAKKQRLSELKETAYGFMSDNFLQVLRDPAEIGRAHV